MKSVLVRGPLLSKSGYGEHARQVFRYIIEKPNIDVRTEILPWGITPWDVNSKDPFIAEILQRSALDDKKHDVSFQIQLPNEWDTSKAEYNVGVTAAVETDRCNPLWTTMHVSKMDKVVVPSLHIKKVLASDFKAADDKICVIGESYYDQILDPSRDINIDLKTSFNFLTVGVLTGNNPDNDRKNLFYMIKWFTEVFKDDNDVGLIVKTNRGRDSIVDRYATRNLLKQVLLELGHTGTPRIYLLHGSMNRLEMNALYRHPSIKAFVSLTRGEGFGLPHLEAAVSGLPVIATNWSAHKEFLDNGKWVSVDYKLKPVHSSRVDNQIFMEGSMWAEPSESDFKRKIRKFKNSPSVPKSWAEQLSPILVEKFSWKEIRNQYEKQFSEILR